MTDNALFYTKTAIFIDITSKLGVYRKSIEQSDMKIYVCIEISKTIKYHKLMRTLKKVFGLVALFVLLGSAKTVNAQSLTQTIRGKIVDRVSQTTIPGATVVVVGTNPAVVSMTDADGNFKLNGILVGRHNLLITSMGYENATISELLVGTGKEVVLNIELKESITALEEVVVTATKNRGDAQNTMATVSSRSFNVEQTRRYAGGLDDPSRLASAFAGVSSDGSVESNAIMVRGNSPGGVLWQIEGMEVPVPSHFANADVIGGGAVTLFSNQMLSNSDFYTGAFPAEYGNAFAGVFDVKLRTGNNEKNEHAIQIGALGMEVSSEGPFKKGGQASYLFNYRYSTLGLVKMFLPEEQGLPVYQDFCFKVNLPTKKAGTFTLWGIGGIDDYQNEAKTDTTEWKDNMSRLNINAKFYPGTAGINHKLQLGKSSYLNTSIGASSFTQNQKASVIEKDFTFSPMGKSNYNEYKYSAKTYISHKFSPRLSNRTGIGYDLYSYDYNNWGDERENGIAQPMKRIATSKGNAALYKMYTESKYELTNNISLSGGIYAMRFDVSKKYAVEPRLGMRWQATQRNAFSFAYGLHSQMQMLNIYFIEKEVNGIATLPNKNLDFSRAQHFVFGYDLNINQNMRLKIEPYYQILSKLAVEPTPSSFSLVNQTESHGFNKALVSEGKGRNYGVDFTLERFLNQGYYYLLTTSIYNSRYKGSDGIERNTIYNNTYVANLLAGKEWTVGSKKNNILGLSGRLYLKGGNRKSPVDQAASVKKQDVVYDESRAFSEQNVGYYRFDLSATYRKNMAGYSVVLAAQINNLLASPTTVETNFNYNTQSVETKSYGEPFPNISCKIEF